MGRARRCPARARCEVIVSIENIRDVAVAEIEAFPFHDYGMDDVRNAILDDRSAQEWIDALADAIARRVGMEH